MLEDVTGGMYTVNNEDYWDDTVEDIGSLNPHGNESRLENSSQMGKVSCESEEMIIEEEDENEEDQNEENEKSEEKTHVSYKTYENDLIEVVDNEISQAPATPIIKNSSSSVENSKNAFFVTPIKTNNPYRKERKEEKVSDTNTIYNYATATKWTPRTRRSNSVRVRFNLKSQYTDPTGNPMIVLLSVMKIVKLVDSKALLLPWVEEGLLGPLETEDIKSKNLVSQSHLKKYSDLPQAVKQKGFVKGVSVFKMGVNISTDLTAGNFVDLWNSTKRNAD